MLVDVFTALVIAGIVVALCVTGFHLCRSLPEWTDS